MNNFLSGLDIQDFGGASNVYQMWLNIGNLIFKNEGKIPILMFLDLAIIA